MSYYHRSTSHGGGDGQQQQQHWGSTDARASAASGARDGTSAAAAGRHAPQGFRGGAGMTRSRYEEAAARQVQVPAQAQAQAGGDARYRHEQARHTLLNPKNSYGGGTAPPQQQRQRQRPQSPPRQHPSYSGAPPGRVAAAAGAGANASTSLSEYEAQQSKLASQKAHRNYQLRQSNRNQSVQHGGGGNGAGGAESGSSGGIMEEALRTSHAYGRLGKPPQTQAQAQPQAQAAQKPRHRNQPQPQPQPQQHFVPRPSQPQPQPQPQQQQEQLTTPQRAAQSSPRHRRRPSPTNSVYSDPEPVLEMDDDDPSVSQPLHVSNGRGVHGSDGGGGGGGGHGYGKGMTAAQVEQYAALAQQQAQAQAQHMHQAQPGRDPPGNGAHYMYGAPPRSNQAKGYTYGKHHPLVHDDVTATPTPSTMTDQTKTTATMSMSTAVGGGGGGGGGAEGGMSMPPYRQHQPHPQYPQHRPQGSPQQRRRPSHPPQSQSHPQLQQRSDQWPPQPLAGQQQDEYFDQRPEQMQETIPASSNRSKKSHIQWDEGVVESPEKRGNVGDGGRGGGGGRGDGGGEDISTAASGHSQFRSRFFRAAAVAAHRDGKIQVDGVTTADAGAGTSGGGPGTEPARQQLPVAPQPSSSPRAPAVEAGNFHTPAPISPRNDINTSMATDSGVVHEAPRQMVGRVERAYDSPAIAAPSPMRVPMRRAIDPEPSPSPQRRALQPPEQQHHVTFQAPHNGPQSILRSPTRSPARTKSSSEAGASSLHQHMMSDQNAIRRTGSYSTSGSTDKSSVARLVAKLNSVKRDDPASALAAIDAIIKSESFSVGGGSGTQDDIEIENADEVGAGMSDVDEMKVILDTTAEVVDNAANDAMQPISQDPPAAQPLFPDVPIGDQNAIAPNTSAPRTDEEEMKSLLGSSEDESDDEDGSFASTVSSITNPTYLGNFKARQGSDNGGLMIQQQYQHWQQQQQQQQQQMAAPPKQSINSGQNQGAGLPPLDPQMRPFRATDSQPIHPAAASTPEASPGRMIMTPPKVTRTKTDPSSADMPSSPDPLPGQEMVSPVIYPAGPFAATTPMSPGEESRTSPIARMRAAAEQQDRRQQSRDNVHRAVASSRDALDALDEQLQQQRQRQVDSGLANGYSRDALDALDEQQARTANSNRDDGDTPAWAQETQRKSPSDRAFDAAAQRYLSSATSPLVRSVSSRPTNSGPSRSPKWQSSTTSLSRNDRNTFRSSPSRSFEDPYIDQTKAVADAFAGVDISFEDDGQEADHSGGGLTEENMNKFDSLHGASDSRYAQSDIGVGRFYAYDDTTAKSPLDIFYERRASASPTKTPAALQKMKARFGPNYSASGEALEASPKSNRREISETTSDFFPSMEVEKGKANNGSFDAEMDSILKEFEERPTAAANSSSDKTHKSGKQKSRSSKRFLPKRLFRNPRASKAAADF